MTKTTRRRGGRRIVWIGFGGLLALMLFATGDTFVVMRQVKESEAQVRESYLKRTQALDQLRTRIFESAIVVRDFLLSTNQADAASQKQNWTQLREQTDRILAGTDFASSEMSSPASHELGSQLQEYWNLFESILGRDASHRARVAQLAGRRMSLLSLLDGIDQVNKLELASGNTEIERRFDSLRLRLLITLGIIFVVGVALAIVSSKRMVGLEAELHTRLDERARAHRALQDLSARLVSVQEQERRAIARELHDEVGQSLSALLMEAGSAIATIPPAAPETRRHMESIRKLAETSVQVIRNMTLLLRPSMLDDLGLVPALEWQAREVSKRTGMRVQITADETADTVPDEHRTCIYRVVQEALHNCARHAHARNVKVQVSQTAEGVELTVTDDGHGFDTRRVRGLGLLGMEERVHHLGGAFQVDSRPGEGTTINVHLPLAVPLEFSEVPEVAFAHDSNPSR